MSQHYFANTVYIIPSEDLALLGMLNSRLVWNYLKRVTAVLGDADKGGRLRWFTQDLLGLPIPVKNMKRLVPLVQKRLEATEQMSTAFMDTRVRYYENICAALDHQIDRLVYELYGLTDAEIRIVESSK